MDNGDLQFWAIFSVIEAIGVTFGIMSSQFADKRAQKKLGSLWPSTFAFAIATAVFYVGIIGVCVMVAGGGWYVFVIILYGLVAIPTKSFFHALFEWLRMRGTLITRHPSLMYFGLFISSLPVVGITKFIGARL